MNRDVWDEVIPKEEENEASGQDLDRRPCNADPDVLSPGKARIVRNRNPSKPMHDDLDPLAIIDRAVVDGMRVALPCVEAGDARAYVGLILGPAAAWAHAREAARAGRVLVLQDGCLFEGAGQIEAELV